MKDINLYKLLPKVDEILEEERIKATLETMPRKLVVDSIRQEIELLRLRIKNAEIDRENLIEEIDCLIARINKRIIDSSKSKFKRVINATGTVIHTNLGRSLLNGEVLKSVVDIATNYSNLEYDLETGQRGSRYSIIEDIVCKITGAEAALVVNNNAAAVMLVLSTLSKNREVIVSRGELIEIGGSFRIPEVMEQSGAVLVEVGTTNKTHLRDYENAINENTSALLKVHTSNYRILGFTSSVESEDMVELKDKYNIPIIEDLGSGVLIDLSKYGLEYEKTVQDSLSSGVDIVTFSGDKLLGGPQAGVIVGKKEYISLMKSNPLTRAFRVDKFTMAALESTLRYYLDEEKAIREIPTLNMITMKIEEIENKANRLLNLLKENNIHDFFELSVGDSYSEVGGGSLPLEQLPTKCVILSSNNYNVSLIEELLRSFDTPIITRISKDKIYFDLRTIGLDEFSIILDGFKSIVRSIEESKK